MRVSSLLFLVLLGGCVDPGDDDKDGSSPWRPQTGPEALSYNAVWSFAPDDVWLATDSGAQHYDGDGWTAHALAIPLLAIHGFAPDDVWFVGGTKVARWDGAEFTVTDASADDGGIEGLASIWGSSPADVFAGGTQSTIAHYNGTAWSRTIAAGTDNNSVWGSGPADVYAVGLFEVAHFDGVTWSPLEDDALNTLGSVASVFGFGADDVWLATGSSELAHWDGSSWHVGESGDGEPERLWGAATDDLWGVGSGGSIVHFDGERFELVERQQIGAPLLRQFTGVHGSGASDVWAVGAEYGEDGVTPVLWRLSR